MNRLKFISFAVLLSLGITFYSCDKDEKDDTESYSLSGTTWVYSNEESGGKNTFIFKDEESVSFKQDWIDSGTEKTETKEGTYTYNHPSVTITVGGNEYAGTIDAETMTVGGFVYRKQ